MEMPVRHLSAADYENAVQCIDKVSGYVWITNKIIDYSKTLPKSTIDKFEALSIASNPYDPMTGAQRLDRRGMKRAFHLGGAAGLLISSVAYTSVDMNADKIFATDIMKIRNKDDEITKHQSMARTVFEMGEAGLELAGDFTHRWLKNQEDRLGFDGYIKHMFRTSAGVVFSLADRVYGVEREEERLRDLKRLERELEGVHDVDWEGRLAEIARVDS